MKLFHFLSIIVYVTKTDGHFYSSNTNRNVSYTEIIAETDSPSLISCTLFCRRLDAASAAMFKEGTCKCIRQSDISGENEKEETWTGTLAQALLNLPRPWNHIEIVGDKMLAIQKGQLVKMIPRLSKEYIFSFDVKITELIYESYTSIIILTTVDTDLLVYGSRTPGIYNHATNGAIHSAVNDNGHGYWPRNILKLNEWVNIKISQLKNSKDAKYWFYVAVDGTQIHQEVNSKPSAFSDVRCYVSSPVFRNAVGYVKNLWLETYG